MIQPREYQQECHDALFSYLKKAKGNPVLELPTGSGKSVIIAMACRSLASIGYRAIILHRSAELVQQNFERFMSVYPEADAGIYCSGLGQRNIDNDFIFATVQSVSEKALSFGQRNAVFVDECHEVSPGEGTQYQTFLKDLKLSCKGVRMIGLTATPYRLDNGPIIGDGMPFDGLAYKVPMRLLLDLGHITGLESLACSKVDMAGVRKSGWEFNKTEMRQLFGDLLGATCEETVLCANAKETKSNLIFASGVEHAENVANEIRSLAGEKVGVITGDTLPIQRSTTIADFRARRLRWLVNCDVLTTGFDAPNIDLIAVMRATQSAGLFSQMCGRGMRLFENKDVCYLLDFGDNVSRHGPIDSEDYGHTKPKGEGGAGETPFKSCPSCGDPKVPAGCRECGCGFRFPEPEINISASADGINDVMEATRPKWTEVPVAEVKYFIHRKEGKPDSMRVIYKAHKGENETWAAEYSDWWCFEHEGGARAACVTKWNKHSKNQCPDTTMEAINLAEAGALAEPKSILVRQDGKYWRVKTPSVLNKPDFVYLEEEEFPF